MKVISLCGLLLLLPSCVFFAQEPPEFLPDVSYGVTAVESDAIIEFHARASAFYGRLVHRRFNTLATFEDRVLRDYFQSEGHYSDYYANFASAPRDGHFEQSRPMALEVSGFRVEGPGRALVRIRVVGKDGQPLRWWETEIEREDRWERHSGRWWIVPGKL